MRKLFVLLDDILESEFFAEVFFLCAVQTFFSVAVFGLEMLPVILAVTIPVSYVMALFMEWLLTKR